MLAQGYFLQDLHDLQRFYHNIDHWDIKLYRLNVCSSPTVGTVFSAMKAEYVVVAEQAHSLGPAYSIPPCIFFMGYAYIRIYLHSARRSICVRPAA